MALAHKTKMYGIDDAALHRMLTDPSGAPATYASKVDVPGAKSMKTSMTMKTTKLRGDNQLLSADSIIEDIAGSMEYALQGFDVWGALTNASPSDSGSTPSQTITLNITQSTLPAFASLEAQTTHVDYIGGDVHIKMPKIMPGTMPFGYNEEDYQTQSFDFTAVPTIGSVSAVNNLWLTFVANETAAAVA
jgi:hypothetical protein